MTHNAILDELHAARRKILAQYGGDVAAYLKDAQARLEASGRPIAQLKQRPIRCTATAESGESEADARQPPVEPVRVQDAADDPLDRRGPSRPDFNYQF